MVSVVVGSDAGVTVDIMLPSLSSKVVVSVISGSAVMEPAAASGVRGAERGCSARSGYIILVVLASTRSVVSSFVSLISVVVSGFDSVVSLCLVVECGGQDGLEGS